MANYEIELLEVNEIDGGVEVFARAWKDGVQLGFSKDGTVDIERFLIYNPPILVPDDNGDIVVVQEEVLREDGSSLVEYAEYRYREDPEEALRQVIGQNVVTVGKEGTTIQAGKIGNTTSTFYPDADTESTSVDGWFESDGTIRTWASMTALTTATALDTNVYVRLMGYRHHSGDAYRYLNRGIALFDTSSIGSDTVESATLSVYGASKSNSTGNNAGGALVSANPASNTALASGDFDSFGSTRFATDIAYADFSIVGYNDFTLNASGLSAVDTAGVSKFGLIGADDLDGSEPTGSSSDDLLQAHSADNASGTTQAPKLVVEHSAGGGSTFIPKVMFY